VENTGDRPIQAGAVHRAIVLAELTGAPADLVHINCDEAARELAARKETGLPIFTETCLHYLTLDNSVYGKDAFEVARYLMTPPLRGPEHQSALWQGIRRGDLDVISTDHCPFCLTGQKEAGRGDFSKIPNGVGGVGHRLILLYDRGVGRGELSLERLVAITATKPAKLFGLYPQKGTLAVRSDADVVVLDPNGTTMIAVATSPSKVDYGIYKGWAVRRCCPPWAESRLARAHQWCTSGPCRTRPVHWLSSHPDAGIGPR
jgi:dihydropyrimidinase